MRFIIIAILLVCTLAHATEKPLPEDLLAQADGFRQLDESAEIKVNLKSFNEQKLVGESVMRVRLKGSDLSLVEVLSGRNAGQVVLMRKETMWVKMPRASRAIRITPIQRLLGEASYGDLGRLRWRHDYEAQYQANAEQTINDMPVWALTLNAVKPTSAYAKIDLYVARNGGWPVQASFYLRSGKLFKTAQFDKPIKLDNRLLTQRTVFTDAADNSRRTEMHIESVTPKNFLSHLFTLDGLTE